MPNKKIRKTLNNSKGPDCTPPNRPCGDRCIPPNWECRTGVNAAGPRGANSAYRSNVIGAAGHFEAAGRDVAALAQPGSKRNVFKTIDRSQRSLYKGLVEITPYPKLDPRKTQGKTPEEIQMMEAEEYNRRLQMNFGLAIGGAVFAVGGAFAFKNRASISKFVKTQSTRGQLISELEELGLDWGPNASSQSSSFPKRLKAFLTGQNQFSESDIEKFRSIVEGSGSTNSTVPFFARGPLGGSTSAQRTMAEKGAFSRIYKRSRIGDSMTAGEARVMEKARRGSLDAARISSARGGNVAEERAFASIYKAVSYGGGPDLELDRALTRDLYRDFMKIDISPGEGLDAALGRRYEKIKRNLEDRIRENLSTRFGEEVGAAKGAVWKRYKELPELDRLALMMDDVEAASGIERFSYGYVSKEWADSFIKSPVSDLVRRDIDRTEATVGRLRARMANDLKTPVNPIYDEAAVDFVWGQDRLDLPAVRMTAQKRIEERLQRGEITVEQAEKLRKQEGAKAAMRDYLNRIRFEERMPLDLLTKEDLVRAARESNFRIDPKLLEGDLPRRSVTQAQILEEIRKELEAGKPLKLDGVRYKGDASTMYSTQQTKTDSTTLYTFNWGADWRRYDALPQQRRGKPCGESFIPRNHKCGETATSSPALPQPSANRKTPNQALKIAAGAGLAAVVAGSAALGTRGLYKSRHSFPAYMQSVPMLESAIKKLDERAVKAAIDKLPIRFQGDARNLVGKAKLSLAHIAADAQGFKLSKVDSKNNFSTWVNQTSGHVFSAASEGDTLITYVSQYKGKAGSFPQYGMAFQTNLSFDQQKGLSKEQSKSIITKVKAMYKTHVDELPDNAIVFAKAYADDGMGDKRAAIYKRAGFRQLNGLRTGNMYAVKNQGKFQKIPEGRQEDWIVSLIKGERYQGDSADRLDKRCGNSGIPETAKCTKQTKPLQAETSAAQSRNKSETEYPLSRKLLTAGGIAVASAVVLAAGKITTDVVKSGIPAHMVPPPTPKPGYYDTFQPGDLVYQVKDVLGAKRAHYAVYVGKKEGKHLVFDAAAGKNSMTSELKLRTIDEATGNGTSYVKALRLDNRSQAVTSQQLEKIIDQLNGKTFRWTGFKNNCETLARTIVKDLPISTQGKNVSRLTTNFSETLFMALVPGFRKGTPESKIREVVRSVA